MEDGPLPAGADRASCRLPAPRRGRGLGFGNGFSRHACERLPGRVLGLDISRTALTCPPTRRNCEFHHLDRAPSARLADLLFTHHVLEHLPDLEGSLASMNALLAPGGSMLHILPCGNPGSFEYELCRLRRGGIDPARQGRFFYEDEGHLRRLTTEQLMNLASRSGCGSHTRATRITIWKRERLASNGMPSCWTCATRGGRGCGREQAVAATWTAAAGDGDGQEPGPRARCGCGRRPLARQSRRSLDASRRAPVARTAQPPHGSEMYLAFHKAG